MDIAIIDLGTITFNLLICKIHTLNTDKYKILHSQKIVTRIGAEGIIAGRITPEAFERSKTALRFFKSYINSFNCQKTVVIGTSMLRNANNSTEFSQFVQSIIQSPVRIISGKEEAEYIFKGCSLAYNWKIDTALIIDIGGGSNECILTQGKKILWMQSFENGMQRLFHTFNPQYPIPPTTLAEIEQEIETAFAPLFALCKEHNPTKIIGASGPFDVFRSKLVPHTPTTDTYTRIPIAPFIALHQELINSSIEDIARSLGVDANRAPMIPLASIITYKLITHIQDVDIIQSAFSLKEGVIQEIIQETL